MSDVKELAKKSVLTDAQLETKLNWAKGWAESRPWIKKALKLQALVTSEALIVDGWHKDEPVPDAERREKIITILKTPPVHRERNEKQGTINFESLADQILALYPQRKLELLTDEEILAGAYPYTLRKVENIYRQIAKTQLAKCQWKTK